MRIGPQPGPQELFLSTNADIAGFGGAAGGGKSYAALLDPVRHLKNGQASALILRRSIPEVLAPGGLWDKSYEIYPHLGGKDNNSSHTWVFPSGFKVVFAHMQHEKTKYAWQGSQIPIIIFDEATHFTESMFTYMLSRNRSTSGVAPYMRLTTNPDATSWVKKFFAPWVDERFRMANPHLSRECGEILYMRRIDDSIEWITPEEKPYIKEKLLSVTFIKSALDDNQILLETDPEYRTRLEALGTLDRKRLLEGDWEVEEGDLLFQRKWFNTVDTQQIPWENFKFFVRYWDLASTDRKRARHDSCYTAGVLLTRDEESKEIYILDVRRVQYDPVKIEKMITATADEDVEIWQNCHRGNYRVRMEQEPGSSGYTVIDDYARKLISFDFAGDLPTGNKALRAQPLATAAERGFVKLRRAPWNVAFLDEIQVYPMGFKDQVDATAGALNTLAAAKKFAFV